jgi:HEAT repeat protein
MPLIRRTAADPPPTAPDTATDIAGLRSASAEERWSAARRLAATPDAAAALGEALARETDQRVREVIFTSLARINNAASVEAVLRYLRSDDANLRMHALDALKAMPSAVAARFAILIGDDDPDVRIFAVELAREAPSAQAAELLCRLLDGDPEVNVCAAAVEVLAEIGTPEVLPALARCARRFSGQPFLTFAINVATARIGSHPPRRNG